MGGAGGTNAPDITLINSISYLQVE